MAPAALREPSSTSEGPPAHEPAPLADRLRRAADSGPSAGGSEIRELFDAVAARYDLLNRLLSLGLDQTWRRRAAHACSLPAGGRALDVATGTGDLAILLRAAAGESGLVVGADLSPGMLAHGRKKSAGGALVADAERLPFPDGAFDAAAIAFGIRNVNDPERAVREMTRVVRPGGRVVVLEFSTPRLAPFRLLHRLYMRFAVPWIGRVVSGRREAYEYLSRSVPSFVRRVDLEAIFRRAGLDVAARRPLTLGIVEMLVGTKTS